MKSQIGEAGLKGETYFLDSISIHTDYLLSYATGRIGDPEAARDIVQETLLAAWLSRSNYRAEASIRTWLTAILKNKICDYFKFCIKQRNIILDLPLENDFDSIAHDSLLSQSGDTQKYCPEKQMHFTQLGHALALSINKLPDKYRQIFIMSELEHSDTEALCTEFSISRGNAHVRLHRAKSALKEQMLEHWFD